MAGGLHGVGSSVVNALSEDLVATVRRDGREYTQSYRRGKPTGKLKRMGAVKGHGTTMHFRPDTELFGKKLSFDAALVRERLEARSYLHKGLKLTLRQGEKGKHRFSPLAGGCER